MPKSPDEIKAQREAAQNQQREADAAARDAQRLEAEAAMRASRVGPFGVEPETPQQPAQDPATMEVGPDQEAERARLVIAAPEATPDKADLLEQRRSSAPSSGSWTVQHNMVGRWRQGEVVQSKDFEEVGMDVQRLVELEAIAPAQE